MWCWLLVLDGDCRNEAAFCSQGNVLDDQMLLAEFCLLGSKSRVTAGAGVGSAKDWFGGASGDLCRK
jgi:hypothetical protein